MPAGDCWYKLTLWQLNLNPMRKLLLFAILLTSAVSLAQKTESVTINGTSYYVYPYPQELKASRTLESVMYADMPMSRKERKEFRKTFGNLELGKKLTKDAKARNKLIFQNANHFYQTSFNMSYDIIPPLDKLPDGKYVQYYGEYYHPEANGLLTLKNSTVAGYFELKNNLLEGNAYWIDVLGDTVKQGQFHNGIKEGVWTLSFFFHATYRTKADVEYFLANEQRYTTLIQTYTNGIENGPYFLYRGKQLIRKGSYKDGEESGEWFIYGTDFGYNGETYTESKDSLVLKKHYTYAEKQLVSHKPYIRDNDGEYYNYPEKYYTFPEDYEEYPEINFRGMKSFAFKNDQDLDLPEEDVNAYDGEEYSDEYEGDYQYESDYYDGQPREEGYWVGDIYLTKAKMVDSVGIINKYDGVYEEFYDNGQIKVRLNYSNGDLVEEDTIFWDNGKPADVIIYDPVKKEYERRLIDYTGVVYQIDLYDSTCMFIKQLLDPLYKDKHVFIEGYDAATFNEYDEYSSLGLPNFYFEYLNMDTLSDNKLKGNIVVLKSWYADTTDKETRTYNADERILTKEVKAVNHKLHEVTTFEFDETFSSVRGNRINYLGDLRLVTNFNGSYMMSPYINDSFPAMRAAYPDESYDLTSEEILEYKNEPFNGTFTMRMDEKSSKVSVKKNKIDVSVSTSEKFYEKLYQDYVRFTETGKTKYDDVLSLTTGMQMDLEYMANMMFPFTWYMMERRGIVDKIEGNLLNGKPNGSWKAFDESGKLVLEYRFFNGEREGKQQEYAWKYPQAKKSKLEYERPANLLDTFPAKTVHYLWKQSECKNGLKSGDEITYNWQGKVAGKTTYKEGYPDGPSFEKNKIASTYANYENGAVDGIVKTYLHLPGKDTILLYELNFQDGALQGESRSYHTNGKLSKRGFFLNGLPIDDYEGYDSLGTRFHYVKFQYSFPVEEKIWEANQLSVRYQFDWRDSIYFNPEDIVDAMSVNNMLYKFGLLGNQYNQPYYGRPSLVEKTGINYHMTKYFPNDTVSRDGALSAGKKTGCWQFYAYDGEKLYEVDYYDTIIRLNDSIQFKSKGVLTDFNRKGDLLSKSYIIEKFEKYDCSHTDHYEIRQFYTFWQAHDSLHRINGYVKNYYDNGVLQSEGNMKAGLPDGIWKYYDPFGKLNHVGEYKLGKRDGRWLSGDLSKSKYLGDICMNPNLPDLEEQMKYQEKVLDIYIRHFKMGKLLNSEYYDLNLNDYEGEAAEEEINPEER